MIRVLLVDDQPLIRSGFRALLEVEDDIEVVAEAADGSEGLALVREHLPDIALIDIQMPVVDGIEATRRIAADPALVRVHVVILTNYGLDEYVFNALRAGAAGFLVKDIEPEAVDVAVVDDGARGADAADTPGGGRGLLGMRERVAVFAGTLEAGPAGDGGFAVHARLPLPEESP